MRAGYFHLFVILVVANYDSAIANNATGKQYKIKNFEELAEIDEIHKTTA